MCFGIFRRGRGGPPTLPGVQGGNPSQLAITTQPPSSATNGVNFSATPVIQLQDAQGHNVAQSGVEIVLVSLTGPGAVASYTGTLGPNGGVLTNAAGMATFTTFKLTGTAGPYQITFGATGFTSITSSSVTVAAGATVAATTTATVPAGVQGQPTPITIQARDISGNAVTTGGAAVLITVTGANTLGPDPAVDQGNGTYSYFYITTFTGTDMVVITLGGVGISGSPYTSQIDPPMSATALPLVLFSYTDIGNGPAGGMTLPRYSGALFPPQPPPQPPSIRDIDQQIDFADQYNVTLVVNPSGARGNFIVNNRFSWDTFRTRVDRFANNAKFADAVARKRIYLFVVDEANTTDFNNSFPPFMVNDACLYHKQIWNNAHTFIRMGADFLGAGTGWAYQATVGGPTVIAPSPPPAYMSLVTNRQETGWSGLDYGWSQRSGQHNLPLGTTQQTMQAYFDDQRTKLAAVNLGMIPGLNLWNGGLFKDFDGVTGPWDTGQGFGYLGGSVDDFPFTFFGPSTSFTNGRRMVCSPAWLQHWIEIVVTDSQAPFAGIWTNSGPSTSVMDSRAVALQASAAFVSVLQGGITTFAARTSYTGLRPAKTI